MAFSIQIHHHSTHLLHSVMFSPTVTEDEAMMKADRYAEEEDVTRVEVFEDGELIAEVRGEGANAKEG